MVVADDLFHKRLMKVVQPFGDPQTAHTQFKVYVRRKGLSLRTLLMK
jgi:hypothetical protein